MDLYIIKSIEKSNDSGQIRVELNPKHEVYKGHFPEFPIMPGVLQVEMLKDLFGQLLEKKIQLTSSKSIKYLGMIDPNQVSELEIDLKYKSVEDKWSLKATIKNANPDLAFIYMKFSGVFIEV